MKSDDSDILAGLTKSQTQAVTHAQGPLMVLAGAGTGKTTVLVRRIAWLLQQGIKPEQILAITFTDKAAGELETRLDQLLALGQFGTTITTFHGFGRLLLERFSVESGFDEQTTVLSEVQQTVLVGDHIMDFPLPTLRALNNPKAIIRPMLQFFSRCKDELIGPDTLQQFLVSKESGELDAEERSTFEQLANAYKYYQKILTENKARDYGDLLWQCSVLLRSPNVQKKVRQTYTHVLVDEYQDTNFAQVELLKQLVPKDGHITVVGDDDQSIYRFRGALVGQMMQFEQYFTSPKVISLTDNFRSAQYILDGAYNMIQHNNPHRLEAEGTISKKLIARAVEQVGTPKIPLHTFLNDLAEVSWISAAIEKRLGSGQSLGEICVLVRSNMQSNPFQIEFKRQNIPFTTESASGLRSAPGISLLVNFLQLVSNPYDHLAAFRVITSPIYGVSGSDIVPILAQARQSHQSLEQTLMEREGELGKQFLTDMKNSRDLMVKNPTSDIALEWLRQYKFWQELPHSNFEEESILAESISPFVNVIRRFEQSTSDASVLHFLANIDTIFADFDRNSDEAFGHADAVHLLTIHQAKGLEFETVYLTNLSADRFPSRERESTFVIPKALLTNPEPEGEHEREERRLAYVAITRAKTDIILTRALTYGGGRPRQASRFLSEIPHGEATATPDEVGEKPQKIPIKPKIRTIPQLSTYKIDDYQTCPLKYKYKYVDQIPIPDEQPLIVGSAMHNAIAAYFSAREQNKQLTNADLHQVLDRNWRSIGFVSAKHEQERLQQSKKHLDVFKATFDALRVPKTVEHPFKILINKTILKGRIDAVFEQDLAKQTSGVTILDFKTTDSVTTQKQADARAEDSLQLTLYALGWEQQTGTVPEALGLYFTASGLFGWTSRSKRQLANVSTKIETIGQDISEQKFDAKPSLFDCQMCPFRHFCPSSLAPDL